jgi:hypothetical protein
MNVQTPSGATGVQGAGASSFQTRLAAAGNGQPSTAQAGPSGAEILQHAAQEMRSMLHLQYALSRGTNSRISNVMKTRHETAKNAIGNIR